MFIALVIMISCCGMNVKVFHDLGDFVLALAKNEVEISYKFLSYLFNDRKFSSFSQLLPARKLQCTDDDNRSYRNVCNMSFVSFSLAVIFIT